ncbi:RHS repeat-associated core domain-containing protein [Tenacibaculum ovolyticum]|uniref:RHS repeat domain-containing protein n=1 Tax=Tenacibaculum ovolyticum TaxID=104270 RepID=UPI0022F3C5AB|nr:RHS repeat-associated core domain-containing protein [Tenacibaculum ovolyticum]WBX75036.1 RHS repeat-associated core domain-containing protein [Tenacibaculum ovolyticum]
MSFDKEEPTINLITWVFDEGTFSIISDYLGTPILSFDEKGNKVWERELDIYGNVRKGDSHFIPFLYQGQYYDQETGLAYNRFRYYNPETGGYISQDPIGLLGGANFYKYVKNSNLYIDPFGLAPWVKGGFGEWFDAASSSDISNNLNSVKDALRGTGGSHEMFPVSQAVKAKELGFTHSELMDMTAKTSDIEFVDVPDKKGKLHTGGHVSSGVPNNRASSNFHKRLIKDLKEADTKAKAKSVIKKHHDAHMRLKGCN